MEKNWQKQQKGFKSDASKVKEQIRLEGVENLSEEVKLV